MRKCILEACNHSSMTCEGASLGSQYGGRIRMAIVHVRVTSPYGAAVKIISEEGIR